MSEEKKLGSAAIKYLRESLFTGSRFSDGTSLSHFLLRLPLEDGHIITYWPTQIDSKYINEFESGGMFPIKGMKPTGIRQNLKKIISNFLSSSTKRCALFETLAKEGDPGPLSRKRPYITNKTDKYIYYFIRSLDHNFEQIDNAVRFARYYPFVGALTSFPKETPEVLPFQEISEKTLEKLISNTEIIIVDAYDAVGFLIWSRSKRE